MEFPRLVGMCGNELLVKYDSGLESGELLDWMIRPGRAILTPDGLDQRLGLLAPDDGLTQGLWVMSQSEANDSK
jgi:hypothetical protein